MKKMYFKKFMSVFMACLMLLSCWVWIAPEHAHAAAGTYDVKIQWKTTDEMNGNGGSISLITKSNNGTGGTTTHDIIEWVNADTVNNNTWSSTTMEWYGVGYPYAYNLSIYDTLLPRELNCDVYVYVRKAGTTNAWDEVGTHSFKDWGDNSTHTDNLFTLSESPEATTFTWSNTPESMSCPKSGSASQTVAVTATDQFGVQMFDPTYSVKGSVCETTGISITSAGVISLNNAANTSGTATYQTGTVKATWGSKTSSKTFTIYDSYYTATFNYKTSDGADTSATRNGYHGSTISAPTAQSYYEGDYLKTFAAWSPALNTTITKDITYNATYSSTFAEADYTAVNEAIAAADAIKAQYGTDYEFKYTHASRTALDAAIDAVVTGLGRTQQSVVDGYAKAINDAIAALAPNTFDVIFLDKDGAILLYEKAVEYKESVTAPADPEMYFDGTNHYTFDGWDTSEYQSVIDDLVINPVYEAEGHQWTTETVPSTCVQAGATKYTCTVCGYSYVSDETSLGDHVWETEYTVDLEPTCTVAGSKSIHCSLCDATKDTTEIPAAGHLWGSQSVAVSATCTSIGLSTRVCDDCGVCEHTIIEALTHDYVETVVAPTCTTKGYTEYVCQRTDCGHSYRDSFTDVAPHSFGEWETVINAACEVAGLEKRTCEDCGFIELRSTEALQHNVPDEWTVVVPATCEGTGYQTKTCTLCGVVQESEVIPATGHSNTTETKDATCTEAGYTKVVCSTCGKTDTTIHQPLGHSYNDGVHSDADCTHGGFTTFTCGTCGHSYITLDDGATADGHNFEGGTETVVTDATCTTDGEKTVQCVNDGCEYKINVVIPKTGHNHVAGTEVTATCTASGYTPYTCTYCDDTYNVYNENDPAKGHDFSGEGTVVTAATCTTDGEKTIKCANCDEEKTEVIAKLGHDWGEWTVTKNPTADAEGEKTRTCARGCSETVTLPKLGHEMVIDTDASIAPTCTKDGEDVYVCTTHTGDAACGYTYTVTVAATGHTWDNGVETTAASCTTDGVKTFTCSCGATRTETLPKTGHNLSTVLNDATCTSTGTVVTTCSNSGCTYNITTTIPVKGHTLTVTTTPATCTVNGSVVEDCDNCDYTKTTTLTAPGHVFTGTETVVTPATCTTDGTKTVKCANCDETQNVTIPATGHDFSGEVTTEAATCTEDGTETVKCANANCEETQTTILPKTGHTWGEWVKVDATNDTDGSWTRTCQNDAAHIETVVIPKGGHVWDNGTVTKPATCEETGTMVYKCTSHDDCGVTLEVTLAVIAHTITTEKQDATCTLDGYVKAYCSVCKKEFSNETTKKIAHSYVAGDAVAPTCTTSGYTPYTCSVCDDTYNVYDAANPATGHTYVEGASTATCTAGGTMTLTCACGATTEIDVPALGHNYVKDETASTEATCADAATETYKCSRCSDSYTVSDGDKLTGDDVHSWGGWQVKESATSTSIGYRTNTCTVCGQIKVETIEATGEHTFTDGEIVKSSPATCTEDGYEERACSAHTGDETCGQTSTITLPKLGHSEVLEYKVATCETKGSTKIVCSVCDTTIEEKPIPALGHAWGEGEVTNSNCSETGKIEYSCTREGCDGTYEVELQKNYTAHDYVTTITVASCTKEGSIVVKCARCPSNPVNEAIAKLEHTWGDTPVSSTDAKCETDGSETYKCQKCEATNEVTLPKTGHTWSEWEVTKASTNTEKGEMTRTCANGCTEKAEIPAGGHNLVVSSKTDASCTQEGSVTYDCDVHTGDEDCGITVTVTLDEIQHTLTTSTTDAKCEEAGSVVTKCENCDTATVTTVIPATGHTYDDGAKTDATCTAEGKIIYTCTAEDCTKTKEVVLTKLQHNYVAGEAVKATCTSSGYTPYECADCASSYVLITENAKGHTFEEGDSTADCTTAGTMTLTCACGAEMTADVPALGHDYQLVSTTKATCAAAATETYDCSRCEAEYTVSVGSKTDEHDWNDWVTVEQATYTSIGYKTRTCKICDKLEVETLQKAGDHTLVEVDRVEPTCEEDGYIEYDCSVHTGDEDCGETDKVTLPATGHTEELAYSAATCTEEGSAKTVCTDCGETIEEETISALGHIWGDEKVMLSTCSAKGEVEFTCTRCRTETKTVEIPVNPNAHSYTTTTTPVSCTQDGSAVTRCTICSYELVNTTIPMTGHNWGDWGVTKAATNEEKGEMSRSCQNNGCTETETVEIPMGGHTFGNAPSSTTPASCTQEGSATYNCTAHTSCGVTITVTLEKTQHTLKTDSEAASCTEEGYVKTYCSVCKEAYTDMTIGKLAHEFEKMTTVDPTCTKSGYTTYTCKNCGESYNEIGADAKGHTYEEVEGSSTATCTSGGTMTLKCACGVEMTAAVPALGHDYKLDSSTEADCAAAATETYKCSHCDAEYTISVGSKTDSHDFDDWTVVENATETSLGYETRQCKVCGKLEVQKIEATGEHKFTIKIEAESKEATCEEAGYETYRCSAHTDCTETSVIDLPKLGHTEKHVYSAATCTGEGLSAMECEVCGKTLSSTVIPALGHSWGAGTVTSQPTCSVEGEISYECTKTDCGATKTEKLPTSGHALTTTTVDAKCEEDGSVVTTCLNCDYEQTTVIKKKGHTWSDTPASTTDATCEAEGSEIYDCANCDEQKTVTVPKLGHTYVAGDEVAPTCTTSGYTVYVCENDSAHTYNVYDADKPATGHTWGEWKVITSATETTDGLKQRTCACGGKEEEIIPAMKHNMTEQTRTEPTCDKEGEIVYKCSVDHEGVVCSYTLTVTLEKLAHTLTTEVTDAKCDEDGAVVTTCENCGNVNITTVIPATGHSYVDKVTTEATCTKEGEKTYTCAHDATHTYTEVIAKLQHNYVEGEEVEATCTQNGYIPYACSACGDSYVVITSAAKGHTYVEGDSTATCEAAGTMTLKCACGAEMTADVPALGHDYQPGASTAATCAAAATQSYDCSRCDASYTVSVGTKTENHKWGEWKVVEQATDVSLGYETRECEVCGKLEVKTIPAIGEHKFTIYVAEESKAPTCEEAGYEVYRCSAHTDCTEVSKVEIPATGHTKTQNYVAPTCENDGVSAVVCTVCGKTLESTVVPALGHSWSAGVITKQPGCFTEGEITYSCSRTDCDATKTEAVQPTGHIWDNGIVTKESTCTVGGEKLFKCTGCDEEKTEALNPLGHSYGRVVTPATCTEQGYTTYTCVKCGDTFVTSYTDAVGHSVGAWVITKEVSCDEDGERYRYCSECDYYETEVIPASEHRWGEWRLVGGEVCAEGAVRQRECTVCGKAERDMLEEGEHFYRTDENGDIIFDNILEPACEHEGFYIYRCTLCGTEVKFTAATPGYEEELAATGHNWQKDENGDIVYVTVKAVTCFADGQKYRTCTNEDCHLDENREYLTVATVGHQLKSMSGKDATCVDNGYSNYYQCIVCGYEHNKVIYPAMGHIDEDSDGVCESCKSSVDSDSDNSGNSSENCDCMCHEDGFMGIIYRIVRFFWKLFGINETCECGEAHY